MVSDYHNLCRFNRAVLLWSKYHTHILETGNAIFICFVGNIVKCYGWSNGKVVWLENRYKVL